MWVVSPVLGKVCEGDFQDGADGLFLGGGEVGEVVVGIGGVQGAGEVLVDAGFHFGGESLEDEAVDHVAAAVFEEAGAEVEVFEGVTGGVARRWWRKSFL